MINKTLQLSYDHLKGKEVKSSLWLCVVYGIFESFLEILVTYDMGLGLFHEDSFMEEAR